MPFLASGVSSYRSPKLGVNDTRQHTAVAIRHARRPEHRYPLPRPGPRRIQNARGARHKW